MERDEAINEIVTTTNLDPDHELEQMEILLEAEDLTGERYELTETAVIKMKEFKDE